MAQLPVLHPDAHMAFFQQEGPTEPDVVAAVMTQLSLKVGKTLCRLGAWRSVSSNRYCGGHHQSKKDRFATKVGSICTLPGSFCLQVCMHSWQSLDLEEEHGRPVSSMP
jgi:hypothetical protein